MYALKERLHHIAHLDEEHADLLVVVAAFYIELHNDAEGADGDCNPDENPSIRYVSYE